jgi:hypothetical protein
MNTANTSDVDANQAKRARELHLRDAVVEGYLETGKALDVPAIAARLRWSQSKVRRVLDEAHGAPNGLHAFQDYRESFSASYPSMAVGGHKVWMYAPATWLLRDMVNELRALKRCRDCTLPAIGGHDGYCERCWTERTIEPAGLRSES